MSAFPQTPAADSFHLQPTALSESKNELWTGRVLSGIVTAFFLFDSTAKLFRAAIPVHAMHGLGYTDSAITVVATTLLRSTIVYLIPRSAFIGAVLLSAYLGGAVATNLRVSAPLFSIVFPVICTAFVWSGLILRDQRLRSLLND